MSGVQSLGFTGCRIGRLMLTVIVLLELLGLTVEFVVLLGIRMIVVGCLGFEEVSTLSIPKPSRVVMGDKARRNVRRWGIRVCSDGWLTLMFCFLILSFLLLGCWCCSCQICQGSLGWCLPGPRRCEFLPGDGNLIHLSRWHPRNLVTSRSCHLPRRGLSCLRLVRCHFALGVLGWHFWPSPLRHQIPWSAPGTRPFVVSIGD
mmetsp:Transcript_19534/g.30555  ORF Transcript_19534/g.30555 Transcript_19534/m.30555 type:complete len:203 (-) Transcript_19534:357-965(-)